MWLHECWSQQRGGIRKAWLRKGERMEWWLLPVAQSRLGLTPENLPVRVDLPVTAWVMLMASFHWMRKILFLFSSLFWCHTWWLSNLALDWFNLLNQQKTHLNKEGAAGWLGAISSVKHLRRLTELGQAREVVAISSEVAEPQHRASVSEISWHSAY